jgi:hypothetical protein
MRDDFDAMVADRFKVLDDVPVPDTWSRVLDRVPVGDTRSRVPFSDEALTMINLETPVPTEPRRKGGKRVLVAGLLAAAAVAAIALVVTRDDAVPADRPAPAVTPTTPPRPLFGRPEGELLVPGTYFVDEVDGTPTARIFVTIGTGWTNMIDGSALDKHGPGESSPLTLEDDIGFITFSRPDRVYLDACHLDGRSACPPGASRAGRSSLGRQFLGGEHLGDGELVGVDQRGGLLILLGEPVVGQVQVDAGRFDRAVTGLGLHRLQRHPRLAQPGQAGVAQLMAGSRGQPGPLAGAGEDLVQAFSR